MEILLLTTPVQHRSENPTVELNPKYLEQWTRALPVTDVFRTVAALSHAIESFNELQIDDKSRLKLLEIYYHAFDHILEAYDELRLRQMPIAEAARTALSTDIMWLYLHLANGYKIIVNNTFQAKRAPKLHPSCETAIYRSIELISLAVLYAQRSLRSVPPLAYLELNQLYWFAQCAEITTTPLRKLQKHSQLPTIAQLYKQIQILIVSSLSTGSNHDIYETYQALERFADQATITTATVPDNMTNCYLIDYFDDQPPKSLIKNTVPPEGQWAILDINPCLQAMRVWLQQTPSAADALFYENERQLLPRFIQSFATPAPAQNVLETVPVCGHAQIIIGLDQVLHYYNEGKSKHKIQATINKNTGSNIEIVTNALNTCTNKGEVIGIITPHNKILSIGFIEHTEAIGNKFYLKVRIINGRPEPIFYYLRANTDPLYGLYFPKSSSTNGHASLLTVKALLNHHASLMVSVNGHTYTIKTGQPLFETENYAQFRFTVMGKTHI